MLHKWSENSKALLFRLFAMKLGAIKTEGNGSTCEKRLSFHVQGKQQGRTALFPAPSFSLRSYFSNLNRLQVTAPPLPPHTSLPVRCLTLNTAPMTKLTKHICSSHLNSLDLFDQLTETPDSISCSLFVRREWTRATTLEEHCATGVEFKANVWNLAATVETEAHVRSVSTGRAQS